MSEEKIIKGWHDLCAQNPSIVLTAEEKSVATQLIFSIKAADKSFFSLGGPSPRQVPPWNQNIFLRP